MVVRFAIRANKAEDSRFFQADKQAADGVRSVKFGTLLAGLTRMAVRLPNKDAFHNELVWLLWRATRVQGAVEK